MIDGKTNAATTVGDVSNGTGDIAVVLTNQVYVMTPNLQGSTISAFSGALGVFPQTLLDHLIDGARGIR